MVELSIPDQAIIVALRWYRDDDGALKETRLPLCFHHAVMHTITHGAKSPNDLKLRLQVEWEPGSLKDCTECEPKWFDGEEPDLIPLGENPYAS